MSRLQQTEKNIRGHDDDQKMVLVVANDMKFAHHPNECG
jgi:hypothetical protein